jgi:hypothetical protein
LRNRRTQLDYALTDKNYVKQKWSRIKDVASSDPIRDNDVSTLAYNKLDITNPEDQN